MVGEADFSWSAALLEGWAGAQRAGAKAGGAAASKGGESRDGKGAVAARLTATSFDDAAEVRVKG